MLRVRAMSANLLRGVALPGHADSLRTERPTPMAVLDSAAKAR